MKASGLLAALFLVGCASSEDWEDNTGKNRPPKQMAADQTACQNGTAAMARYFRSDFTDPTQTQINAERSLFNACMMQHGWKQRGISGPGASQ